MRLWSPGTVDHIPRRRGRRRAERLMANIHGGLFQRITLILALGARGTPFITRIVTEPTVEDAAIEYSGVFAGRPAANGPGRGMDKLSRSGLGLKISASHGADQAVFESMKTSPSGPDRVRQCENITGPGRVYEFGSLAGRAGAKPVI